MENEVDLNIYTEHIAGIYGLLKWVQEQKEAGMPFEIHDEVIYLNKLTSYLFFFDKNKRKKEIFIGIPSNANFFKLVKWKKAILREKGPYLYFLADVFRGDNMNIPDIPPFAIAFFIDLKEKREFISQLNNIVGREYWINDEGKISSNLHKPLMSLPLEHYSHDDSIVEEVKMFGHSEIIKNREIDIIGRVSSKDIKFEGDMLGALSSLNKWNQSQQTLLENSKKLKDHES